MALALIVFLALNIFFELIMISITLADSETLRMYLQPQLTGVMLVILTALAFLTWSFRVHRNLAALGARDVKGMSIWAIAWFFIPFANLFVPYFFLREIWRGSDPNADMSNAFAWKNAKVPYWVITWWVSWVLSVYVVWSVWYISSTLKIEAAVLAILFVGRIDIWQVKKYGRLLEKGDTDLKTAPIEMGRADPVMVRNSPSVAQPVWNQKTAGEIVSSPAVAGGRVFFGSGDGYFYALDAATGEIIWRSKGDGPMDSSPAAAGDAVCFSGSSFVTAVDAASGHEKWKLTIERAIPPSLAVDGGRLYFGTYDKCLHALDVSTGHELWRFKAGDIIDCCPAIADGIVFVGCFDKTLYAIETSSGILRWSVKIKGAIDGPPAVNGSRIFFGSHDCFLRAADIETGSILWEFKTGSPISTRPAIDLGLVVFGSYDNYVYALDEETGVQKWEFQTENSVASSPVIADGAVYFGSFDRMMYSVDLATGTERWRYPSLDWVQSSPAIVGGVIYFGSKDGHFYAIRDTVRS